MYLIPAEKPVKVHACHLCINANFENGCPRTRFRHANAMHAFKSDRTLIKVLNSRRRRDASFVSSSRDIQLRMEVSSFPLGETGHIVHNDIEHHHRRRRLR